MPKDKKPCSSCSKNVESKTSISKGSVQDDITNFKRGARTVESPIAQNYISNGDRYRTTHLAKTQPINDNKKIITKIIMLNILSKLDPKTNKYQPIGAFQTTQPSNLSERAIFQDFPSKSTSSVNIPVQMNAIGQIIYMSNSPNPNPKSKSQSQSKSADGCCQHDICSTNDVTTQQYSTTNNGITTNHFKCTCNDKEGIPGRWDSNNKQNLCWTKQDGYSCYTTGCGNYNPPPLTYTGTSNINNA